MTGLEPAASGVTGQRSNQLSYTPGVLAAAPERGVRAWDSLRGSEALASCIGDGAGCQETGAGGRAGTPIIGTTRFGPRLRIDYSIGG